MSMLCTSLSVDDAMFSDNEGNRPESKMTPMFHPVRAYSLHYMKT